jgi:beta-xylosidase
MNRSIPPPATILLTLVLLASACSSATPQPATTPSPKPPPTATLTPIPTDTPAPTSTPTELPVFWDDFNNELLPGWTWIRENDAMWSITSEPGYLRIVLDHSQPPRNLLVRDVSSDNFQIMTHVLFKPTSNFQFAGLLVYQDDETRAAFGRAYCDTEIVCVGNGIYFDAFQDGQYIGPSFGIDTTLKDEAYLRLDKQGTLLSGYYSEDGSTWILVGEHQLTMTDPKVGLITTNSFIVGMVARFDYFTVVEMP